LVQRAVRFTFLRVHPSLGRHIPCAFIVCGRNLQCQPVRKWAPERNAIGHTHGSASSGAKAWELNGILECKFLSKNAQPCQTRLGPCHPTCSTW
jgi:hypothetical protein